MNEELETAPANALMCELGTTWNPPMSPTSRTAERSEGASRAVKMVSNVVQSLWTLRYSRTGATQEPFVTGRSKKSENVEPLITSDSIWRPPATARKVDK